MSQKFFIFLFSFLIILISGTVYLITLSPTLAWIDSGELATACATLGIPHPTGYPLYACLGRIFSIIPLMYPIFNLNLLSLACVVFTSLFLFFTFLILEKILWGEKDFLKIWIAFLLTLLFSFSPLLWSQATSNEVYSLNIFFCSLILFLGLFWYKSGSEKILYLLFFILGLSFSHHLSTLFPFVAVLFLIVAKEKGKILNLKKLLLAGALFFLGLTLYLYLPMRASQNPISNWGDPTSWLNFKRHITGWMYQIWMFKETKEQFLARVNHFLKLLVSQFHPLLFLASLLGFFYLLKKNSKILLVLLIVFILNAIYGINYYIEDIDFYFLPAFLVTIILAFPGMIFMGKIVEKLCSFLRPILSWRKLTVFVLLSLYLIFSLSLVKSNYFYQDKSKNYFAYDFAKNILRSAKKDAIIFTQTWDFYSPWLYLRYVEKIRPDVEMFNFILLDWEWYQKYVQKNYPVTYSLSQEEFDNFKKVEKEFLENPQEFKTNSDVAFSQIINGIILKNLEKRPVYLTILEGNIRPKVLETVPEGSLFRLSSKLEFYPYDFPNLELRGITDPKIFKDKRTISYITLYPTMYYNRGMYLSYLKREIEAERFFNQYQILTQGLFQKEPTQERK
jgi:hypothetical protein